MKRCVMNCGQAEGDTRTREAAMNECTDCVEDPLVKVSHETQSLVIELGKADIIIHAMLNAMTLEQKTMVSAQLEASGVSLTGMTRANERRVLLDKFSE